MSISKIKVGTTDHDLTAARVGVDDVGSATQPVYIDNGVPKATTYTLGKSVPSDAKFTDTTYSAAGSSLGLVKTGGDVTISSGVITVNDDSHNHTIANVDSLQSTLDSKLAKLTYEWNKSYNAGGTAGYLLIGSFPMYDSNVTIDIDSTTNTTYHGTVIIATQNVSESSIGSAHTITVYGDPTGAISDAIRVVWTSGSRNYNVYFVPSTWSKNLIHIRAIGNYLENTDESKICTQFTTGTAPTTTSGLTVVNALRTNFNNYSLPAATSSALGGVKVGSNITNSSGTISLTKANVTSALGYTPPTTNTTYSAATTSAAGLMSAADKTKLDGIATGANNYTYTLPNATSSTLGGVKVGSNISVSSGTISLTKANVTAALGYTPPTSDTNTTYSLSKSGSTITLTGSDGSTTTVSDSNTTYSVATTSANGLMSSSDKTNLNTVVSHASNTENPHGVTAAQVGLGNVTNNKQMPIAGGTFTGNAVAYSTNRSGTNLRNISVQNSSGTEQSTNRIIMRRK